MTSSKRALTIALIAFLMGAAWIVTLRFALYKSSSVHYHANFGLFVNGKQDTLDNFTYYEEVQACNAEGSNNPRSRGHMHQPNNHTVHVHDAAVTWGDFFANLGYGITDKSLTTNDGVFVTDQDGKKLSFILNGQTVDAITNHVIGDEDDLLISYGTEDKAALKTQYAKIPTDAAQVDAGTDPASCGGSEKQSAATRLKHALNLTN
jgi:hypothetical protein